MGRSLSLTRGLSSDEKGRASVCRLRTIAPDLLGRRERTGGRSSQPETYRAVLLGGKTCLSDPTEVAWSAGRARAKRGRRSALSTSDVVVSFFWASLTHTLALSCASRRRQGRSEGSSMGLRAARGAAFLVVKSQRSAVGLLDSLWILLAEGVLTDRHFAPHSRERNTKQHSADKQREGPQRKHSTTGGGLNSRNKKGRRRSKKQK